MSSWHVVIKLWAVVVIATAVAIMIATAVAVMIAFVVVPAYQNKEEGKKAELSTLQLEHKVVVRSFTFYVGQPFAQHTSNKALLLQEPIDSLTLYRLSLQISIEISIVFYKIKTTTSTTNNNAVQCFVSSIFIAPSTANKICGHNCANGGNTFNESHI